MMAEKSAQIYRLVALAGQIKASLLELSVEKKSKNLRF